MSSVSKLLYEMIQRTKLTLASGMECRTNKQKCRIDKMVFMDKIKKVSMVDRCGQSNQNVPLTMLK